MKLSKLFLFMGLSLTLGLASNGVNNFKPLDITPRSGVVLNTISEIKSMPVGTKVSFGASINGYVNDNVIYASDLTGHGIKLTNQNFNVSQNYVDLRCTFTGTIKNDNGPFVEVESYTRDYSFPDFPKPYDLDLANVTDTQICDYVNICNLEYVFSEERNGVTNFNFIASDGNEISVRGDSSSLNTAAFKNYVDAIKGVGDITITGNLAKSGSHYYMDITDQILLSQYELTQDALGLADMIISDIACDTKGTTPPDVNKWNDIASCVVFLTEQDVKYFKKADAKDPFIGEAIEKYDFIIAKYGSDVYQNFLNRTITSEGQNSPVLIDNTNMIITIVSISIVAISMIALLVIYKRKKVSE